MRLGRPGRLAICLACALVVESIVTSVAWADAMPLSNPTVEPRPAGEFIVLGLIVSALAIACWLALARILRTETPGQRHRRRRREDREA